jgi:hypothetical protein
VPSVHCIVVYPSGASLFFKRLNMKILLVNSASNVTVEVLDTPTLLMFPTSR